MFRFCYDCICRCIWIIFYIISKNGLEIAIWYRNLGGLSIQWTTCSDNTARLVVYVGETPIITIDHGHHSATQYQVKTWKSLAIWYRKIPTFVAETETKDQSFDVNNIVAPGVSGRLINPNNENSPGFHAYVIVFQWPSAVPSIT